MSVPLPGWFAAAHDRPIAGQLEGGIRGLLIDTHYADRLPNGRLRTELERRGRAGADAGRRRPARRSTRRCGSASGSASRGEGERGLYLCHSFCEIGATPLAPVLADIREFLVANPGEVLVVVNQDAITPEDFVGAVRDAGLERFAYRGPVDGRWPTLREMIDSGQRVLFLAENRGGAAPWYHPAYEAILQETPFAFGRPAQLTDPGRAAPRPAGQPRAGLGAAVPRQPLDHHGSGPAPVQRRPRERLPPADGAAARVRAHPRPHAEPRRRGLRRAAATCCARSTRSTACAEPHR